MKNCPLRASVATPQDFATAAYATSAKAKAIACLSTEIRFRCGKTDRSDGEANAQHRTHGIPFAELPGYFFLSTSLG